jgi:hypothetical protein
MLMPRWLYRHVAALRRVFVVFALVGAIVCGSSTGVAAAQSTPPVVATDGAHATGSTTATVEGNGDPEGQGTTLHADYALASAQWCTSGGAASTPAETAPQSLGSGHVMVSEILVKLEGLTPGSEYCTELVATNASGTTRGGQVRFTMPPAVASPSIESESATNVTERDATLEAMINPGDQPVRYQFQVAINSAEFLPEVVCPTAPAPVLCLTSPVTAGALPIGFIEAGAGEQTVSLDLASAGVTLQPGATYHYRVLVVRSVRTEDTIQWEGPTLYGSDQTFTTSTPQVTPGGAQKPGQVTATPVVDPTTTTTALEKTSGKVVTNSQKLAKALKACSRKPKKQRASCRAQAEKRYAGPNARGKRASKGKH